MTFAAVLWPADVGEDWNQEIRLALAETDIGLMLISPAFLGSDYIGKVELPALLARPVVPVLLEAVNPAHQDMHGLDAKQIFGLPVQGDRRAFADCDSKDRRKFSNRSRSPDPNHSGCSSTTRLSMVSGVSV